MMYQRLWYIILISVYPVLLTRPFAYVFAIKYAQTNHIARRDKKKLRLSRVKNYKQIMTPLV